MEANYQGTTSRALVVNQARAAEMLDTTVWQLWKWRTEGKLHAIKMGKSVRFAVSDLESFVDAHREGGSDAA